MRHKFYLAALITLFVCVVGWTAQAAFQKPGQNWEYQEVALAPNVPATATLNRHGVQGWELVSVVSACPSSPSSTTACSYWAYFKRPR